MLMPTVLKDYFQRFFSKTLFRIAFKIVVDYSERLLPTVLKDCSERLLQRLFSEVVLDSSRKIVADGSQITFSKSILKNNIQNPSNFT